jgi:hypothetical protein
MQPHQRRALAACCRPITSATCSRRSSASGRRRFPHPRAATGRRARLATARRGVLPVGKVGAAPATASSPRGRDRPGRPAGCPPAAPVPSPRAPPRRGRAARPNGPFIGRAGQAPDRQRRGPDRQIERLSAPDQHRRFGHGGLALVGKLERRGARRRDQHARAPSPGREAGLRGQQVKAPSTAIGQPWRRHRAPAQRAAAGVWLTDRTP